MCKSSVAGLMLTCCVLWSVTCNAQEEKTWKGEILDLSCYVTNGAKGSGHAACAKTCLKSGQPMGLLTEDGTVLLLAAGEDSDKLEALKDLAGEEVEVSGKLTERGGIKMVVVTEGKKADR